MKLDEAEVMAFPRKLVEHAILGLYDQINLHLVKLVGFDFPPETREHFRRELNAWLGKIQRLRMKPNNRTGSFKFYFDLLFDYPFGGVEIENMRSIMDQISDEYEGATGSRRRRRWSSGCARFTWSWQNVCIRAKTCST